MDAACGWGGGGCGRLRKCGGIYAARSGKPFGGACCESLRDRRLISSCSAMMKFSCLLSEV